MGLVGIVLGIALAEYLVFVFLCGQARARAGIPAPATSGDPAFERYFRVQQNTVEQLVVFIPALILFGHFVSEPIGAALGLVFVFGRGLYAHGYYQDPAKRGPGFGLTILANSVLTAGALVGAIVAYA